MTNDLGQENNVINNHPDVASRLAEGYERWWESIMKDNPNERYAYIKAGTPFENPVRICSHDLLAAKHGSAWHQYGAVEAVQALGTWKVQIVTAGSYRITLRRFPVESNLGINSTFPARIPTPELERDMPAGEKSDFTGAYLSIADFNRTVTIDPNAEEINFSMHLEPGKYDMEARLLDSQNRNYPSYFVYIEYMGSLN
jgi:hypothetical protein